MNATAAGLGSRLTRLVRTDTSITGLTTALTYALRLVSTIILSRLLAPEDFGAIGVLLAFTTVLNLASDAGFQAFLIRHARAEDPVLQRTIWTVRLLRALVLAALALLFAPLVAEAIRKPELTDLLRCGALVFLLDAVPSTSLYLAVRRRLLLRLGLVELSALVVQICFAVAFALWIGSYWAIVAALVAAGTYKTLVSYIAFSAERPRLAFDRASVRELLAFAKFVAPSSFITLILLQADRLILSRLFTLELLGLYVLALSLAEMVKNLSEMIVGRVLFVRFAEQMRVDSRLMDRRYLHERRFLAPLFGLASGGLIGLAPIVVAILYDHRYQDASFYLQLLGPNLLLYFMTASAANRLVAEGRMNIYFQTNLIRLAWIAVMAPVGLLSFGAVGLIAAFGSMELPAAVRLLHALRWNREILRQELGSLLCAAVALLVGLGLSVLAAPLIH